MGNLFDYAKLSQYVNAIVDRRTKALAISVSSSTGYLKSLTLSAASSASTAADKAVVATTQATTATDKAADASAALKDFTSTYLGVQTTDPTKSILNNDPYASAFYIRKTDGRLRWLVSFTNGVPNYQDATVKADRQSIIDIGSPLFLVLDSSTKQTVKGEVAFSNNITFANSVSFSNSVSFTVNPSVPDSVLDNTTKLVNSKIILQSLNNARNDILENTYGYINSEIAELKTDLEKAIEDEGDIVLAALTAFSNRFTKGSNAYGLWETRPGIIEMYGYSTQPSTTQSAVSITFPLQLPDLSYVESLTPGITVATTKGDLWVQVIRNSRSQNGFSVQYQSDDDNDQRIDGFSWRVICHVPMDYVAPQNVPGSGGGGGGTPGDENPTQ